MESKENTDEDVKRNFLFFFSSSSSLGNPKRLLLSSFFCRPEKVVTLFFLLSSSLFFHNYLASYPSFYSICRVKFLFSSDERRRWEILLGSLFVYQKKKEDAATRLVSYRLDNLFYYSSRSFFFS